MYKRDFRRLFFMMYKLLRLGQIRQPFYKRESSVFIRGACFYFRTICWVAYSSLFATGSLKEKRNCCFHTWSYISNSRYASRLSPDLSAIDDIWRLWERNQLNVIAPRKGLSEWYGWVYSLTWFRYRFASAVKRHLAAGNFFYMKSEIFDLQKSSRAISNQLTGQLPDILQSSFDDFLHVSVNFSLLVPGSMLLRYSIIGIWIVLLLECVTVQVLIIILLSSVVLSIEYRLLMSDAKQDNFF